MSNGTDRFVEYLFEKAERISPKAMKMAEQCQADYAAVTVAGAAKNRDRWTKLLNKVPDGNAALIGLGKRVDSRLAALINGFNAHSLELDDGQRYAMIHLGAAILSAIEAARADYPMNGGDCLRGIVMGYEAACRCAIAMQPGHKERGYHAAGTCGTIGAAMAVGFALRMDRTQIKRVLTLAAGSAAGMLELQEQGSEVKPYNLGRAAMDGLTAACMGLAEFAVPDDVLAGERGFFRLFSDTWSAEKLTEAHEYFEIERIYVKPYASCRHSHSAIEAALTVRKRIDPTRIERVEVETYRLGVKGHDHTDIRGVASAKLSTPYAVSAALLYGRADLTMFEPLNDAAIALASRVRVRENPELTRLCPEKRAAVVRVCLEDGTMESARVDYAKGDPENPMTEEELKEKWRALSAYAGRDAR